MVSRIRTALNAAIRNATAHYNRGREFSRKRTLTREAVMADANSLISTNASAKPVYAWFENGVIKWWCEAEDVNAGVSLSRLCCNMQNLTDISGLNEWQTNKVTDMSFVF